MLKKHEVILKGSHGVRVVDRDPTPLLLIETEHHPGRVLMHSAKSGAAQHLHPRLDANQSIGLAATAPGIVRHDLLDHVHGAGLDLRRIVGLHLPREHRRPIGKQTPSSSDLPKEHGKLPSELREVQFLPVL